MYHLVTGLYASFTQKPRYNVLLLGISGSGKSAWLDKVRSRVTKTGSRSLSRFHPTVGQNVLDLNLAHTTLHFWDLGGEESLRRLWSRYYDEANVLVWAMDSQDWAALALKGSSEEAYITEDSTDELAMREARRQESWRALVKLRSHSRITSLPLLVLFTRIDELEEKQVSRFERNIKQVMREQFAVLEAAEKTELEEEMNHLDHTLEGQSESRHIWSEWEVIVSSARSGTGTDEFVEWLHTHARKAQVT